MWTNLGEGPFLSASVDVDDDVSSDSDEDVFTSDEETDDDDDNTGGVRVHVRRAILMQI